MTIYHSIDADSGVLSVEFGEAPQGNIAFITLRDSAAAKQVRTWLCGGETKQQLIAQTSIHGQPTLITQGALPPAALVQLFDDQDMPLQLQREKQKINWWAQRGVMGITGQLMQLTSATHQIEETIKGSGIWKRKKFDPAIGMFAILNLMANAGNMIYGAQKEEDLHREHYVKSMLNDQLAPHLAPGAQVVDVNDQRLKQRNADMPPLSPIARFNQFAQRNSVRFFELGLRFVAALALVIPFSPKKLGKSWEALSRGHLTDAVHAARGKNPITLTEMAGLGFVSGKIIAWFSKVRDPYDTKPHTLVDTVREEVLFPAGSLIEATAGAALAGAAFRNKKIGIMRPSGEIPPHHDWLGVAGGALFTSAYLTRLNAHFGSKHVDMNEIIAHSSDMLAQTTPHERAQLMADTAAQLTEHFSDTKLHDSKLSFGKIYALLNADIARYHPMLAQHNTTYTQLNEHSDNLGIISSKPSVPQPMISHTERLNTIQQEAAFSAAR